MEFVLQTIANGLLAGALYGLVALGLGLLMGVMKFLNIAHGTFIILGGYLSFWLFNLWGIDPFLSIPLVMIAMFLIGLVFYRLALSPLLKLPDVGMRIDTSMLITFGLIWVLDNAMTMLWTPNVRTILTSYTGETFRFFGARFSFTGLCGVGIAVLVGLALYSVLSRTYFGKHLRAATQDAEAASLCGVNVQRVYLISTGIAIALAGVAGAVIVSSYSISASGGIGWLLIAFVVMVLAGEGNINAIIPAGLVYGLLEAGSVLIFGVPYRQAIALLVFVLVLMFKPQGLFAKRE
ncbi:MAG: branched-chain amino acid ABC transporter permease [Deltaproteobacteria bacterium]|nr:branched-chain amino acid ABC transporter permease [Deltaproteobacteria bacterium]MBW1919016.1 branched-chain amino acid ABC transporter permease [Deltaproteobacteria bacterium]MBW1934375.1 branched-chain amino acid ABC transporter permease [Deltaproteobacteria bacterium]MBW1976519.1 branched-chain amino acid ABC transporter permease [Deltaproteobacteria bacterium]MBW2043785.1 branched-chain amino acid ABC transporter permease [Deltaproteobacteria bacterium]